MGMIFSSQPNIKQNKLITTIYCYHCQRGFLFNDYYKHVRECQRNKIEEICKYQFSPGLNGGKPLLGHVLQRNPSPK